MPLRVKSIVKKTVKSIQSTDDHIFSILSSSDQIRSQVIDNDKIIVVSMKRLSFFECASTVLKNENDDDDKNHKNDEIKDDDENEDNDRKINDRNFKYGNHYPLIYVT
ncbi:unnamed protein product [Rhizophagus irregularis]|nr:unnamed protein product [Rhizophagus irregularis]